MSDLKKFEKENQELVDEAYHKLKNEELFEEYWKGYRQGNDSIVEDWAESSFLKACEIKDKEIERLKSLNDVTEKCRLLSVKMLSDHLKTKDEKIDELKSQIAEAETAKKLLKEFCAEWNERCEPTCDKWGHEEECAATNLIQAKKNMQAKIDTANTILKSFKEQIEELEKRTEELSYDYSKTDNMTPLQTLWFNRGVRAAKEGSND